MNKREVVEVAYRSFLKTFSCPAKFIIDKPEPWIIDMVKNRGEITELDTLDWQSGNEISFKLQLKIASGLSEHVFLLEDDYLWLNPKSEEIINNSVDKLLFISPYDHPNHYFESGYTAPRKVTVEGGHHWQNIISSTLTFATTPEMVRRHWNNLTGYGTVDDIMWKNLGCDLWSPIPSLATHMETDYLSPTFKWNEIL